MLLLFWNNIFFLHYMVAVPMDILYIRVPDPDPNLDPDPHVFGPPGSGSSSQMYVSGSFFKQKSKKNVDSYGFVTSFGYFIFEK
jgi:hypothetical protein